MVLVVVVVAHSRMAFGTVEADAFIDDGVAVPGLGGACAARAGWVAWAAGVPADEGE